MLTHEQRISFGGGHRRLRSRSPGLFARLLTGLAGVAALTAAFVVSIFAVAAVASVAVAGGAYLWWKTRALRRQLREHPPGGHVIEGEVVREAKPGDTSRG